jgi:signal peptidase I
VSLSHDLAHRLTRPAQSLTLFHHLKPTCAPSACYRPQSRPNFRQYSSSTSSSSSGGGGSGDSWLQRFYLLLGAPWRGFRLLSRNKTARRMFSGLLWLPAVLYFTKNFYSVIRITGGSMSPSLNPDATQSCDIVLTNKLVTQDFSSTSKRGFFSMNPLRPLQIGDVVIMISPLDPTLIITKRILALGGDIVSRSSPAAATSTEGQASDDANEQMRRKELIRIAPAHVWVEGDANTTEYRRDNDKLQIPSDKKSRDSREFGPVSDVHSRSDNNSAKH